MGCGSQRAVILRDPETPGQMAQVNADGQLLVQSGPTKSALSTGLLMSVGTSQVALLAANADREWAMIQNHDSSELKIRFSDGGDELFILPQYGVLDLRGNMLYTGALWGIRDAATGNASVLEA